MSKSATIDLLTGDRSLGWVTRDETGIREIIGWGADAPQVAQERAKDEDMLCLAYSETGCQETGSANIYGCYLCPAHLAAILK